MSVFKRFLPGFLFLFVASLAVAQEQSPFFGTITYRDGREQSGTVLWHRQKDLILIFDQNGLYSCRPSQAQSLTLTDARFGTERHFVQGQALHMPHVRGLAELVGSTEKFSVVAVNPGIYLSPGSLATVRLSLESSAGQQAYTREDGPHFKRSLFRIFRSFCKSHGPASAATIEQLYLVDNAGIGKARKITLAFALKKALSSRRNLPLLKAVLAREGSQARAEGICRYLDLETGASEETLAVTNR